MAVRFVPLRRIAALSVTITLLTAPIASAQSRDAAPSVAAPANTALLSPAAFARLVQLPPANVAPTPVATDSVRPSLLRQATAAVERTARATAVKAPQQKSWVSRHKLLTGVLIGVGAFFLVAGIFVNLPD